MIAIPPNYLLFLGDAPDRVSAKTASGILQWRPDLCVGQLRLNGETIDLGLPDLSPAEAVAAGAGSLVIGIAPVGGRIEPAWRPVLIASLQAGLDLVSGLHMRLNDDAELVATARAAGRLLHDVRQPGGPYPIATGRKRSGRRLLTVGTDCAIGKKYTALAIHRAMRARGIDATFRATGQTGILIAGGGIAIDTTVSDFAAGAAEALSPDNDASHWDVIEGQGSLFHPAYAAVSLALLHGSQPDAIVLCHDPTRAHIDGYPGFALPSIERCIEANLAAARLTNPAVRAAGIALDTSLLIDRDRKSVMDEIAARTGLPVVDPLATGADAIVDGLLCVEEPALERLAP
jgi:uncharacterized NAD-dependent epimerase/dehydratase family protein